MSFLRSHLRTLAVALCSVAVGAGAGAIAVSDAASGQSSAPHASRTAVQTLAPRVVQGELMVRTKTGYRTVHFERGIVKSVSGRELTLTEGTAKDPYQSVTEAIPAEARIRDNGAPATLAEVTPGQRVIVMQGLKRTLVRAHTRR